MHVDALVKAWLTPRVSGVRDGWGPGVLDVDVQLTAHGTVLANGTYSVEPRSVTLKSWWRDPVLLES